MDFKRVVGRAKKYRLILAEKPSQARDIAVAIDENYKVQKGYIVAGGYIVTWAIGHLVELYEPEDYDSRYRRWRLSDLPIVPEEFLYKVKEEKQFRIIAKLLARRDVEAVIIATDPGREGELIARLILREAGWNWEEKPTYRFWTSKALTPSAVREALENLRPVAEFDRLYLSALMRQWADWIVGINASRGYTLIFSSQGKREVYSVGRVQTPTLKLIVDREVEIKNFKPVDYWLVKATFSNRSDSYSGTYFYINEEGKEESRIYDIDLARRILDDVRDREGVVEKIEKKLKKLPPPRLFSLTTLQQIANRKYGFSASRTLDIAQSLYEKKYITYPRTESVVLHEDQVEEVGEVLRRLRVRYNEVDGVRDVSDAGKRVFDSRRLTDHHAIIPTGKLSNFDRLSEAERKLLDLIIRRFIAAFYSNYEYESIRVITRIGEYRFLTVGKVLRNPGWLLVYDFGPDEDEEEGKEFVPSLYEGSSVKVIGVDMEKKQTEPPKRYTEATLIDAMVNAWRFTEDEDLRKILKECDGIGTPATRSSIIETLIKRNYVVRRRKELIPTDKAVFLIEKVKGERIADIAWTAVWEKKLEDIAKGRCSDTGDFLRDITGYVNDLMSKLKEYKKRER